MQVDCFTVGPFQENCYVVRADGATEAVIVDPGAEEVRLIEALDQMGVAIKAILITHTHVDHIGACAAVAEHTGAPVYCPKLEVPMLQDPEAYVRIPGLGPLRGWEPEETVAGGERLTLAGLTFDVVFTPGHSMGHVTYAAPADGAIFSGDVLFAGSVGRVDLPGGDWPTLEASIGTLLDMFGDDTRVHPGHMGITTLGRERATNPFLTELQSGVR